MSQIISAIPANALLPVAGALVGWVGHMAWYHAERAHVARGMALIRRFMDGNDDWADAHKARFALTTDPDVTGEVLHVEPHQTGEHPVVEPEPEHKPNCPDLFYCPTVGGVESGCHGGFDVCCTAPELHQPVDADGLARLADEVGLAQALSDEPEHDDEDAPADDTDRPGLWLVLLAIPVALWDRAREWWRSLWAKPEPYRGRHWVAGTQHTGQYPIVPAQRSGDADA